MPGVSGPIRYCAESTVSTYLVLQDGPPQPLECRPHPAQQLLARLRHAASEDDHLKSYAVTRRSPTAREGHGVRYMSRLRTLALGCSPPDPPLGRCSHTPWPDSRPSAHKQACGQDPGEPMSPHPSPMRLLCPVAPHLVNDATCQSVSCLAGLEHLLRRQRAPPLPSSRGSDRPQARRLI